MSYVLGENKFRYSWQAHDAQGCFTSDVAWPTSEERDADLRSWLISVLENEALELNCNYDGVWSLIILCRLGLYFECLETTHHHLEEIGEDPAQYSLHTIVHVATLNELTRAAASIGTFCQMKVIQVPDNYAAAVAPQKRTKVEGQIPFSLSPDYISKLDKFQRGELQSVPLRKAVQDLISVSHKHIPKDSRVARLDIVLDVPGRKRSLILDYCPDPSLYITKSKEGSPLVTGWLGTVVQKKKEVSDEAK